MAVCSDPSLKFLKNLGYNVIRLPREGVEPLSVIGWRSDSAQLLGTLSDLITGQPGDLPQSRSGVATDIEGQSSASLKIGVGLNILNGMISALGGGTLGASVDYTNARKIKFHYENVTAATVDAIPVGRYLRDGDVDQTNPVSLPYLTGSGKLLVLVDVLKSNKIKVEFEASSGSAASLDVPVIANAVGGKVSVDAQHAQSGFLTFEGTAMLSFGFKCFQVVIDDGDLKMASVKAGGVFLASEQEESEPVILIGDGTPLSGLVEFG
ncbi:hypothetical protein U1701_17345 [Sphingomonas sp. PB2P19]|uniref:gasdermin n=1 Tax=Sphingomonas rhamnosi TaxID=3096156 RepID=UPI002FC762E9